MDFKKFILDDLPNYFFERDSYKDAQGKGLLERYLGMFGGYINEEVYPQINNYLDIIDASICDKKYLNHLSDSLGNPPDVFQNEEQYRNLLSYIVSVYKIKGTRRAYELFFSILGFDIIIEEIEPIQAEYIYDNEGEYDRDDPLSTYDQSMCAPCSVYNIRFFYADTQQQLDNGAVLLLLQAAIEFNEPINATLGVMSFVINLEDSAIIKADDDIQTTQEAVLLYDSNVLYDDGHQYDNDEENYRHATNLVIDNSLPALTKILLRNVFPEFSGIEFNLPPSFINITDQQGNTILYQLTQAAIQGDYIELGLNDWDTVNLANGNYTISGRIYITNNTFYSFTKQILQGDNIVHYVTLYYNI